MLQKKISNKIKTISETIEYDAKSPAVVTVAVLSLHAAVAVPLTEAL